MALPDVAKGQAHVAAHNDERHAINDLEADLEASEKNQEITLVSGSEYFRKVIVADDGTPSTNWPNRLEFEYKPNPTNTVGQHLTAWFNEYGEFRCTPAKTNTVPLRLFTKELSTDADHDPTVPVFEMVSSRSVRTPIFGLMADGTMYTTGPIERRVPLGPTLKTGFLVLSAGAAVPANTPPNTLIVRTA